MSEVSSDPIQLHIGLDDGPVGRQCIGEFEQVCRFNAEAKIKGYSGLHMWDVFGTCCWCGVTHEQLRQEAVRRAEEKETQMRREWQRQKEAGG